MGRPGRFAQARCRSSAHQPPRDHVSSVPHLRKNNKNLSMDDKAGDAAPRKRSSNSATRERSASLSTLIPAFR